MKKHFKSLAAVILCLCLMSSLVCPCLAAPVSAEADLSSLSINVPVIKVDGFGESIYKGLSTESESDDVKLWPPETDTILGVIAMYGPQLAIWLGTQNYDAAAAVLSEALLPLFEELACDENGVPNPDTGIKNPNAVEAKSAYGYENQYSFGYDWRLDMDTIAAQLGDYIAEVMAVTGSDKVALTAMSMGNCVLMTYICREYYEDASFAQKGDLKAVIYTAGAMNGVASCGDPFGGNINIDTTSLMRFLSEVMMGNTVLDIVYYMLESMYASGVLEPVAAYANNLCDAVIDKMIDDGMLKTLATMPGFFALMSQDEYAACREFYFGTPEKQEQFAGLIEKNDKYHNEVQANNVNIVTALLANGINTAIFAEYGYTMAPVTSDNNRMTDGVITTAAESFGATCAEVDGTLGDGYVQAVACPCGENHLSADGQIDASTCAFPDITWFGKYMRHSDSKAILGELFNLIIYGDTQVTVHTYTEYPQFLVADGDDLVPLTAENGGVIVPFPSNTLLARIRAFIESFIATIKALVATW